MAKLEEKDFKYYKKLAQDDISFHDTKLAETNSPDEVVAAYQGHFNDQETGQHKHSEQMIENYLFIFASTALPTLFYQVPRLTVRSKRDDPNLRFQAAVLNAYVNVDFNDKAKEENQLAIIDALLPYGFGCIKNGYNSRTRKVEKPVKPSIWTGKTEEKPESSDVESEGEFIEYERSICIRMSPKDVYLDKSRPFGHGNRITFKYIRTLQELINCNLYTLSENFISHYGAKTDDKREKEMPIFETWIRLSDSIYKLVWTDGWNEEMAWVKTEYKDLPRSLLRFNKMGDVLYNIAHGTLGLNAQKELNYLNELWKKHIDNIRNQVAVHLTGITESGRRVLQQNQIGGMVETTTPIPGSAIQPIVSAPMDADIFANINNVREYLKLVLSVSGGKGGGPESELATIERSKALGDALRTAGVQDEIRTFVIDQIKQRIKNVIRLGSPEMILKLQGEGLTFPELGKPIMPGDEIRLGAPPGFDLKTLIKGDLDFDFTFDVDITSAAKPDFPVIRKQIIEGATFAATVEPKINAVGKKIDWDALLVDYFSTFDTIPDAKKYVKDMSEEEKAIQQQNLLMQQMSAMPKKGTPAEQNIRTSAENVAV